jgi:AhpD family alkylhydroperoxidase
MARITPLPYDQWDDEIKKFAQGGGASEYEEATIGVMAKVPQLLKAMFTFQAALIRYGKLSPKLREMVRLRVAFHNQCRSCMAVRYQAAIDDGLTEGLVCSLEKPEESPELTPREKAALAYADASSIDHFSIDDSTFNKLREHFSEEEILELGILIATCIGFGRHAASMHMVDALPEAYKEEGGKIAPWTHAPAVVGSGGFGPTSR